MATPPHPPSVPGFEVEALVGRGAMGEVWRARQIGRLQRTVAIKLIRSDCLDAERLRRFEIEARALSAVDDPRIVRPFEVGFADDGRPYIAMEFVEGMQLSPHGGVAALSLRARVQLVVSLLSAVESLHGRGIVHRDLKPGNVLVVWGQGAQEPRRADVRIIDLGLAKFLGPASSDGTLDGALVGTPEFMSPEQAGTVLAAVSERSDVFSIGVMLYTLVEGSLPWRAPATGAAGSQATAYQQLLQSMRAEPPRPCGACDAGLARLIRGAIESDPMKRTPTARALREELERWLGGDAIVTARSPARALTWLMCAGLLGMVMLAIFSLRPPRTIVPSSRAPWHLTRLAWIEDSHGLMIGSPAVEDPKLIAPAWRNPRGLDVDHANGVAYWTDYAGRIERIRLDGRERMAIGAYPKACGVDVDAGRIAWTVYGDERRIWCASDEGVDPRHVTTQVRSPTGIRAVEEDLYVFSDWESNGVYVVRRGAAPDRLAFVDGVYGIDFRDRWVYYGDRTTMRVLATNIDDRRTVVLVDDEAVGAVWQVVVSPRGDRVWWTRQQPDRAICTAAISLDASAPAKVDGVFPLERDPWGLAILEAP